MDNIFLEDLPLMMRKRAVWARKQILEHPKKVEVDEDDLLAWVYHKEDKLWYSMNGNYSGVAPKDKMRKRRVQLAKRIDWENKSDEIQIKLLAEQKYYSKVRKRILERDSWTCQKCGQKISKLHVHHIVKRKEERVDADDNLITLCHSCHKILDGKEYGTYKII